MASAITARHWRLDEIESKICHVAAEQLDLRRADVGPHSRLIEDLNCDSLELVELIMKIEEIFAVTIPDGPSNDACKAVFARQPFRLRDLAEVVYLQQGMPRQRRTGWKGWPIEAPAGTAIPFTQLGGRFDRGSSNGILYEPLERGRDGLPMFRRRTDGMRCALLPAASVEIGNASRSAAPDEQPLHTAAIDEFLIDAEPVSATAYARFLNSIGYVDGQMLLDWFMLEAGDHRCEHELLIHDDGRWQPLPGTERFPMVLVSWYGANAYSLWANGRDWLDYRETDSRDFDDQFSFLPSEAQWEYAARGPMSYEYPWGDGEPAPDRLRSDRHRVGQEYTAASLPMSAVNEELGMSPLGLHHMAGNVWHWCRDWYDPAFYRSAQATWRNPQNRRPTGVKSERGGSWVGPATLARCSYRRARPPLARGRCLGFRCLGDAAGARK
ncbi:MAG: SUMF1/EgtB/PvdO family nonheme iron enzyme [Pirellulales bacterium]